MLGFNALPKQKLVRQIGSISTADGVSLPEILVTLAVVGVLSALVVPIFSASFATRPLDDSITRLAGTLNLMKVKASSQTSAYRMRALSANTFAVEYASNCSAAPSAWQSDGSFMLEDRILANNVSFASVTPNPTITPWSVCFNSRGLADRSLDIRLVHANGEQGRVQVFQGGVVKTY